MELREEIREMVMEELKSYIKEELTKKDFIQMAREIRRASPEHHKVLTAFAIQLAKSQNPRFDEARFREAVETGKGI